MLEHMTWYRRKHKTLQNGSFGFYTQISPEQGSALVSWGRVAMGTDLGKEGKGPVSTRNKSRWGHKVKPYSLLVEGPGSRESSVSESYHFKMG